MMNKPAIRLRVGLRVLLGLVMVGLLLGGALAGLALAQDLIVYPGKGQTPEQQ